MVISSSSHVLTYDEVARALPSSNLVVSAKFAPLSQSDAPLSCLPPILSQDSIQAFYKGYDVDPRRKNGPYLHCQTTWSTLGSRITVGTSLAPKA